jgi:hypothetical protein
MSAPQEQHVADLTALLDLMENFTSNEQRARYLLSSNWMREHGAAAATWGAVMRAEAEALREAADDLEAESHYPWARWLRDRADSGKIQKADNMADMSPL